MQGETVLLLRKGGIRESGGQFQVASRQVLLLPTYEHQQAPLLKPEFQSLMDSPNPEIDSDRITFIGWADITHVFCLKPPSIAYDLLPHLIWNRSFVEDRIQWRPDRPLYGMALRAYRLPSPMELPRHKGLQWLSLLGGAGRIGHYSGQHSCAHGGRLPDQVSQYPCAFTATGCGLDIQAHPAHKP